MSYCINALSCNRNVGMALVYFFACVSTLSTGCSTLLNGTTQRLTVSTTPQGATVLVDGQMVGNTPCAVVLRRARDYTLVLRKDGYDELSYPLSRVPSRATLGNIWLVGLFGLAVDGMSGANYKFAPEFVQTSLVAIPTYASADSELREQRTLSGRCDPSETDGVAAVSSSQLAQADMDLFQP